MFVQILVTICAVVFNETSRFAGHFCELALNEAHVIQPKSTLCDQINSKNLPRFFLHWLGRFVNLNSLTVLNRLTVMHQRQ
jgi:hypothetical protein